MKTLLIMCSIISVTWACGGGLIPYTPSTGESQESGKRAGYYIINKGVARGMFDVKSLQPVFREIRTSGNERNPRNLSPWVIKRREEQQNKETENTETVSHPFYHQEQYHHFSDDATPSDAVPVLNLHKIR
ncbi:MAG: hypothetical protein ACQEQ4_04560 [Fibrobacterota bacterium]